MARSRTRASAPSSAASSRPHESMEKQFPSHRNATTGRPRIGGFADEPCHCPVPVAPRTPDGSGYRSLLAVLPMTSASPPVARARGGRARPREPFLTCRSLALALSSSIAVAHEGARTLTKPEKRRGRTSESRMLTDPTMRQGEADPDAQRSPGALGLNPAPACVPIRNTLSRHRPDAVPIPTPNHRQASFSPSHACLHYRAAFAEAAASTALCHCPDVGRRRHFYSNGPCYQCAFRRRCARPNETPTCLPSSRTTRRAPPCSTSDRCLLYRFAFHRPSQTRGCRCVRPLAVAGSPPCVAHPVNPPLPGAGSPRTAS